MNTLIEWLQLQNEGMHAFIGLSILLLVAIAVTLLLISGVLYKRCKKHRKKSEDFEKLLDVTHDACCLLDENLNILKVNDSFLEVTGYEREDAIGFPLQFMDMPDSKSFSSVLNDQVLASGEYHGELAIKTKFKGEKKVRFSLFKRKGVKGFIVCFAERSDQQRLEEQLNNMRHFDPLTELPNRGYFRNFVDEAVMLMSGDGHRVALLFVDLDNFRNVNDALGPTLADELIKQAAKRIQDAVSDIEHCEIGHMGADEFVVLLQDCESGSKYLSDLGDKILSALSETFALDGHELNITASIGVATYPDGSNDGEMLLQNADTARYSAKKLGKNNVSFYTQDMNEQALRRTTMEVQLRKAIERNELVLFYQPKVDLKTMRVVSSEALIRWQHPEMGMVSPAEFIPLAEQTGLIIPIGDWIIRTACRQTSELQKEGYDELGVAVNLSAFQFNKGDVAGVIAQVVWETGLDPAKLELELTESVVMGNAEKSLLMLRVLKSMGVKIAIDDFGTGYSSLSHLREFPLDTLKIDQSFVFQLETEPEDAAIVSTIISMAKRLDLKVVAEGVENEQQLEFLKREDCDIMQGYFFSKPVPFEQFAKVVRENHAQADEAGKQTN